MQVNVIIIQKIAQQQQQEAYVHEVPIMQNKRAGGACFLIFLNLTSEKQPTLDTRHSLHEINFIYNLQNGERTIKFDLSSSCLRSNCFIQMFCSTFFHLSMRAVYQQQKLCKQKENVFEIRMEMNSRPKPKKYAFSIIIAGPLD